MRKISEFLSENFLFLVVKFSVYLNRRVFVMFLLISVGNIIIIYNSLANLFPPRAKKYFLRPQLLCSL